jgi:hypothetical protein
MTRVTELGSQKRQKNAIVMVVTVQNLLNTNNGGIAKSTSASRNNRGRFKPLFQKSELRFLLSLLSPPSEDLSNPKKLRFPFSCGIAGMDPCGPWPLKLDIEDCGRSCGW